MHGIYISLLYMTYIRNSSASIAHSVQCPYPHPHLLYVMTTVMIHPQKGTVMLCSLNDLNLGLPKLNCTWLSIKAIYSFNLNI